MSARDAAVPVVAVDDVPGVDAPVRRLAILTAAAIVLGVLAAALALPKLAPPAPTQSGERLFSFDPKRVRAVEISLRGRKGLYEFVRRDGIWTLYGPEGRVEAPADRVEGFLGTLAGLTRLVEIAGPDVRLADYGLEPPRAAVTVRDGRGILFAIGDRNPPLTALYVQVFPSANIELVGSVLLWEFDKLVALIKTLPVEQREPTDAAEMR
ncbi:DUF4340 domain-containing protein [Candidatus Binatia bacterium]|jgi:hypothetical protein|nr:DUF4340 domain-containing protein [Candidatus Binatia bacterium]